MSKSSARRVLLLLAVVLASVMTTGAIATDPTRLVRAPEEVRLTIRAVDAQSGTALPVRVRLVPRSLLAEARLFVDRAGRVDTALAPGDYDLFVSHGPEWSIVEKKLTLEQDHPRELRVALAREVDASAFTACDLHVHTEHSQDGSLALAERITTLLAEDVHFAVLTDHNQVTDADGPLRSAGIGSLPGVEVTSWDPEFGHFNVFPAQRAPAYKRSSPARLLAELRREPAAFVQINHPRLEAHIGYFELVEQALAPRGHADRHDFDGLEVWNGYDLTRPERRDRVFRDWLRLLARGRRLVATGGSDSHHLRLPYAGYPRTYVQVPRSRASDGASVLAALKAGRAFVTSGPILALSVEGLGPGDTLRLAPHQHSVSVQVRVDAPAWMDLSSVEIWLGEERVRVVELSAARPGQPRALLHLDVPVADERTLLAVVRGERGMSALLGRAAALPYAFTNPVWLRRQP